MFESLSEKLQRAFKNLKGEGRLTEQHIDEALKEIRIALLEADVNFKVVKQFTDAVRTKAVGQDAEHGHRAALGPVLDDLGRPPGPEAAVEHGVKVGRLAGRLRRHARRSQIRRRRHPCPNWTRLSSSSRKQVMPRARAAATIGPVISPKQIS